jgi:hypothetical protein
MAEDAIGAVRRPYESARLSTAGRASAGRELWPDASAIVDHPGTTNVSFGRRALLV